MKLWVNGQPQEVAEGVTLAVLLGELGVKSAHVAVLVNAEIVRRTRHAEHALEPGDKVEIVTFVGGG